VDYKNRISRLKNSLQSDGLVITNLKDIRYLSGFTGTSAIIYISADKEYFITDSRYELQINGQIPEFYEKIITYDYYDALKKLCMTDNVVSVTEKCPLQTYKRLEDDGINPLVETDGIIGILRQCKDEQEIDELQSAFQVAGDSFISALNKFQFGQKETEWAAALEYEMKIRGASGPSFDTIVGSGYRGAMPHGVASEKIVAADEPVVIDFGADMGYCSDITRIVYNGNDEKVFEVIEIVRSALLFAMEGVSPGVKCCDIDNIARDYIDKKGYGEYFTHSLGHGVGLDVHETPVFSRRDDTVLKEGMVLTIEPGIYLPENFGIRLEDTIAVNENGCFNLTGVLDKYFYRI